MAIVTLTKDNFQQEVMPRTMSVLLRLQISLIRQTPAIFTEALCFR